MVMRSNLENKNGPRALFQAMHDTAVVLGSGGDGLHTHDPPVLGAGGGGVRRGWGAW